MKLALLLLLSLTGCGYGCLRADTNTYCPSILELLQA